MKIGGRIIALSLLLLSLLLFFHSRAAAPAGNASGAADTVPGNDFGCWCDKTPHPEPCKRYFTNRGGAGSVEHIRFPPPKRSSEFLRMLVESAVDRAVAALAEVAQLGQNCTDGRHRAAWADCFELYQDTVLQLNRTLQGVSLRAAGSASESRCTDFDAQTWLSAALTNLETCRLGSADLNISDFITPIMSSMNLSQLISNSLAVNAALIKPNDDTPADRKHFPRWVSGNERRLLRSRLVRTNLVVAKDGSGHFQTVQAAIDVAGRRNVTSGRFIIYVKRGVYEENILVRSDNNNIMLVGDGMRNTIITGGRSVQGGYTTLSSATAAIEGLHFIAKGLTFRNTAGAEKGQAVALRSSSDLSVFYQCSIEGYQDTLFVYSQRQFYRNCYIYGTVDFIFGNAAAVFQNCTILPRRPIMGQSNIITAQGRSDPAQNSGISIHNSRIIPAPDLEPFVSTVKTYLGRPWMKYSRTVILKTYMDSLVSPVGWSPWLEGSVFGLDTSYYGEYENTGPSSATRYRVKWKGFHIINNTTEAAEFTVGSFIVGGTWLPSTGVPFTSGL